MNNEEKTIEEIANEICKTRQVVTLHKNKFNELQEFLNSKYKNWNCKFMIFGETVHVMRKNKFIEHDTNI